jgi:hypothetical protein
MTETFSGHRGAAIVGVTGEQSSVEVKPSDSVRKLSSWSLITGCSSTLRPLFRLDSDETMIREVSSGTLFVREGNGCRDLLGTASFKAEASEYECSDASIPGQVC